MLIRRRDPLLNELLSVLDERFINAGCNPQAAYESLLPAELAAIDKEIEHCLGFRYYMENFHCILSKSGGVQMLYPLKEAQEWFLNTLLDIESNDPTGTVRLLICKGRQLGISTICSARIFHWTVFREAQNTLVVAQDIGQAGYLFDMSRFAYDNLPWWMRPEVRYDQKDRYLVFDREDEQQRLMNPGLRSQIIVAAANQPQGVAIGKGLTIAHGSELSAWKDGVVLAEQLLPAVEGPGSKGLMESTARGRGNFFHRLWKAAEAGDIPWTPLFIPAFIERTYSIPIRVGEKFELTEEETKARENVFIESGRKIPLEHFKWRRAKEAESRTLTSEESVDQEYPLDAESAFQATGLSAFNKRKLMEMLKTTCRNPVFYGEIDLQRDEQVMPEVRYLPAPHITLRPVGRDDSRLPGQKEFGSRLYVWEKPERGRDYYLAGDPAMGIPGGAFSCAEVLKIGRGPEPDVQVAEWHGWMDPEPFARVLAALGYWYNEAQVSIEMNNECGGSCHTEFTKMLQYPNWFQWQRTDTLITKPTNYLGWVTNDRTRRELISKTRTRINEGTVVLRSKPLVDQLLNFARDDGGRRYEDQEGSGDRAMALMVCILCAHISDWALEAAMKPPPPGTYRCMQCQAEYAGDKTREDKAGVRVCPNGHPVELIFVDETNTVRFPGDVDTESELRHIGGEEKVPADVIMWEDAGDRGQGLPMREGELWKTF